MGTFIYIENTYKRYYYYVSLWQRRVKTLRGHDARVRRPSDRHPGRHDEDVLQRGRATNRVPGVVVSRRGVHARDRFADAETRRGRESGQRVAVDGDGVDGRGRGAHGRKREEVQTGDVGRECRDGWWRHVLERDGVEERVRSYESTRLLVAAYCERLIFSMSFFNNSYITK